MPLSDVPRTTSFRLALLFLLLFGTCSIALFAFLHWQITQYLTFRLDDGLQREQNGFLYLRREATLERLNARLTGQMAKERPFTLFDSEGHWVAGNRLTLPAETVEALPLDRPFAFTQTIDHHKYWFHGQIHLQATGEYLLVAQDMAGIRNLSEYMIQSLVTGGIVTTIVGLIGAVIAGTGAVRRIGAVTRATQSIVNGDLSRRLPTNGGSGDLDRLSRVINHMLEEIERLMHEVKGVCDNIAHDLRTPLTRLLAGLERTRRRASSTHEYAEAVDEAIIETKGLLRTFAAMLRISEVESGARRAGFKEMDLAGVVTDVVEFYEPMAEEKQITLLHHADTSPVSMRGDPNLLFEAVANLVDNALKFTPQGGRIDVRTFVGAERLGVEVSDSGPGIPEEERQAVLRRFYRTEESRNTEGSGLGLPLVAAVARLHGMDFAIAGGSTGCRITISRGNIPS